MADRLPNEASFLRDVAAHEMTVFRDDGLYRHLRFRNPKCWAYGFDIVTWPGYLAYTGDMGSYNFSRLPDMFECFRDSYGEGPLSINPGYWGEKVQSVDRNGPLEEYSPQSFIDEVCRWADDAEASQKVRRAVVEEIVPRAHDGYYRAIDAAMNFECDGFRFDDFYEAGVKEIGGRFLWCCYALPWAIRKYYAHKEAIVLGQAEVAVG